MQRGTVAAGVKNILRTPLTSEETQNAVDVWNQHGAEEKSFVDGSDLRSLLSGLQVPISKHLTVLVQSRILELNNRISFRDFILLLEQAKTLHTKWLHRIRGQSLDDDLLDAFVAVGGLEDTSGNVDVGKMKGVINEFNLDVDLDRIIREMDTDGNADIDFGEFADLLREEAANVIIDKKPPVLSSQIILPEDDDESLPSLKKKRLSIAQQELQREEDVGLPNDDRINRKGRRKQGLRASSRTGKTSPTVAAKKPSGKESGYPVYDPMTLPSIHKTSKGRRW
jgi:Ca2+-binding EF-hand superfamily protein